MRLLTFLAAVGLFSVQVRSAIGAPQERSISASDRAALIKELSAIKGPKRVTLTVSPEREATAFGRMIAEALREGGFDLNITTLLTPDGYLYDVEVHFRSMEKMPKIVMPLGQALRNAGIAVKAGVFPDWPESRSEDVHIAVGKKRIEPVK